MNSFGSRYIRFIEMTVATLLMLYSALMFAVKGGMNGSFLLLLLLSLSVLIFRPRGMPSVVWSRETTNYLLAMAALPVAIFLSQSYHQQLGGHPYDAASRFLLALPIFMLLQRVRFSVVAMVQYGFPLAAMAGCVMLEPIAQGRYGIATLDLIHFGDFELMLGVLSVLSINWTGTEGLLLRVFKTIGFVAGIYASIASGSRGGWVALPIFLVIYIYFKFGKISVKAMMAVLSILIMTGLSAYSFNQEVHHRFDEVTGDLAAFDQGNPDTPVGIRLQLFKVAVEVVSDNPVFGVGPEGFAREMAPMLKAGKITPLAADLGKGEVHNELLSKAAGLGLFGLLAMLMIYLVPLRLFFRAMKSVSIPVRQSGMLGMVFVSGFMVFGLTVEILNLTMAAAFYALTVAVLLAACLNYQHGEFASPDIR